MIRDGDKIFNGTKTEFWMANAPIDDFGFPCAVSWKILRARFRVRFEPKDIILHQPFLEPVIQSCQKGTGRRSGVGKMR
jgi:hypothetical protein